MTLRGRLFLGGILGMTVGACFYAAGGVPGIVGGIALYCVLWLLFERLPD